MLKMFVLQKFYGLSDFELEKQCIDRISSRKFIDFPEYIQDSIQSAFRKELLITEKKKNVVTVAKPTCLPWFENKKNDSGSYFYSFKPCVQKRIKL